MELKAGDTAPDFTVKDQDGNTVTLSDFRGKDIILYFYPKDDTPGCTKEGCGFRDDFSQFKDQNIVIFGVSLDDERSHQAFIKKYGFPFQLLCDTNADVSKKYNVYGSKKLFGMGITRTTFLIDKEGKIKEIIKDVNCDSHSKDVLMRYD